MFSQRAADPVTRKNGEGTESEKLKKKLKKMIQFQIYVGGGRDLTLFL